MSIPSDSFQKRVLDWFDQHGRKDLPWQQAINPYRVWVSEIMLQQTQVSSVIAYYKRFMERFPNLDDLAQAEQDEVLQYWAGLGYYARARNLHQTARLIMQQGGAFPQTSAALEALPGIGRSTAGAILSIACGQSQAILDGNVKRVLSRFAAVEGWPGDPKVARQLWQISEQFTPSDRTADYTQAMMDLGATLCTRSRPRCHECPLAEHCQAYQQNQVSQFPQSRPKKNLPVKHLLFLLSINAQQEILFMRRPPSGIWGGLWSLPEYADMQALQTDLQLNYANWSVQKTLGLQRHTFSHFHLDYTSVLVRVQNPKNNVMELGHRVWYKKQQWSDLGLPAPIKRLLQQLESEV